MHDNTPRVSIARDAMGETTLYTLTNRRGFSVTLSSLGARIVSVTVPDRNGRAADVVAASMGHGRLAHSHWRADVQGDNSVKFTGPDIGDVNAGREDARPSVTYVWRDDNSLELYIDVTTYLDEVIDSVGYTCFNLDGAGTADVLRHTLWLGASRYISGGRLHPVKGTPMDFTTARALGDNVAAIDSIGGGIWIIDDWQPGAMYQAATLACATTGRQLDVYTTLGAVSVVLHSSRHQHYGGIAIECRGHAHGQLSQQPSLDNSDQQLVFLEFRTF